MSRTVARERPRPQSATVIAIFLFAATMIALVTGVSLLFPNALLDRMWKLNPEGAVLFHSIGPVSGVFLLALGAGTFFAARGLLRGRPWAWRFAVILFAMDACGNLASYFVIHDAVRTITGAFVSSVFLFLLWQPDVRRYFLRRELTPNHKPSKAVSRERAD